MKDSKGREVFDVEIDLNHDGSAFFTAAAYEDGTAVPHGELEWMDDAYPEIRDEMGFERQQARADMLADYAYDTARE